VFRKFVPFISAMIVFSFALTAVAAAKTVNQAEINRAAVIHRLEEVGATPKQAEAEVAMLNAYDLATLAAHPEMIHRAGATDTGRELFWGIVIVLIVVGITAAIVAV
jgi:hypothetical protein